MCFETEKSVYGQVFVDGNINHQDVCAVWSSKPYPKETQLVDFGMNAIQQDAEEEEKTDGQSLMHVLDQFTRCVYYV